MAKTTKKKKKSIKRVVRRSKTAKKNRRSAHVRAARVTKVVTKASKKLPPKPLQRVSLIKPGKTQTKVNALITLGRERGYVTYDEILREFPTIEDNVDLLEEMYERFNGAGIDVLEGGGMLEDTSADSVLASKKLHNRRSDAGYDSVQMYLREIGQYPLLNGAQEKTLAKRIVDGDD